VVQVAVLLSVAAEQAPPVHHLVVDQAAVVAGFQRLVPEESLLHLVAQVAPVLLPSAPAALAIQMELAARLYLLE
jgi:hypothetical protein